MKCVLFNNKLKILIYYQVIEDSQPFIIYTYLYL